jgi:hypothetical protein
MAPRSATGTPKTAEYMLVVTVSHPEKPQGGMRFKKCSIVRKDASKNPKKLITMKDIKIPRFMLLIAKLFVSPF